MAQLPHQVEEEEEEKIRDVENKKTKRKHGGEASD
jgi:hypothetical protein